MESETSARCSRPVRWAFAIALIWGLATVLISVMIPESGMALAQGLSGMLAISLGLGVRRGSRLAAWALVAFAVLDAVARFLLGHRGFLLPLLLFVVSLRAALYLGKHASKQTEGDAWNRFAYEFGFFQAGFTLLVIVWSLQGGVPELGDLGVGLANLLDVAILSLLALAVYRQKRWGVYGLLAYQFINAAVAIVDTGLSAKAAMRVEILALYGLAAFYSQQARALRREAPDSGPV